MSDSIPSSKIVCTIVRADAWNPDPDEPHPEAFSEALYDDSGTLCVVNDLGFIEDDDWRWEGCDDVIRRDLPESYSRTDAGIDWPGHISALGLS